MESVKLGILLLIVGLTNAKVENDLNKSHKDKYHLHKTCELALHKHIDEEMHAHLLYSTMAASFNHNSVGRKGFASLFLKRAEENREHTQKFIDYINVRGGRFAGFDVKMPTKYMWSSGSEALQDAVNLEKHINNKLHYLHNIATEQCNDSHLTDYLETEFFDQQVKSIDNFQRLISVLSGMDDDMGEFLLDQQLMNKKTEL